MVMVLARCIKGAGVRVETVLAHADGFGVIFKSSHALWVTPDVDKFREWTAMTVLHGKSPGSMGVIAMMLGGMSGIAFRSCGQHGVIGNGRIVWQTSLGRLLVVLIGVLRRVCWA